MAETIFMIQLTAGFTITDSAPSPVFNTNSSTLAIGDMVVPGAAVTRIRVLFMPVIQHNPPPPPSTFCDLYNGSTVIPYATVSADGVNGYNYYFTTPPADYSFTWPTAYPNFRLRVDTIGRTVTVTNNTTVTVTVYSTPPAQIPPPVKNAPSGSGKLYNTKPRCLLTLGTHTNLMRIGSASVMTFSRTVGAASGSKLMAQPTNAITAGSFSFQIRAANEAFTEYSDYVTFAGTVANPSYNQPTLTANTTKIKAVDITELRAMLSDICAYYGLPTPTWASGAVTTNTTTIARWTTHVNELRSCIDSIRTYVNNWDNTTTTLDIPAISWISIPTNKPTVAVMNQIRNAITTL